MHSVCQSVSYLPVFVCSFMIYSTLLYNVLYFTLNVIIQRWCRNRWGFLIIITLEVVELCLNSFNSGLWHLSHRCKSKDIKILLRLTLNWIPCFVFCSAWSWSKSQRWNLKLVSNDHPPHSTDKSSSWTFQHPLYNPHIKPYKYRIGH